MKTSKEERGMTEYLPFPDTVPLGDAITRYTERTGTQPNTMRIRYAAASMYVADGAVKYMKGINVIEHDIKCLPGEYWLSREENNGH